MDGQAALRVRDGADLGVDVAGPRGDCVPVPVRCADHRGVVVTVHRLPDGCEYATPPRLGATLTRSEELRRQREIALAHGWRQVAIEIETEICYMQRDRGEA